MHTQLERTDLWRKTLILTGGESWLLSQLTTLFTSLTNGSFFYCAKQTPSLLAQLPATFTFHSFSASKNVLGQECDLAILDFRHQQHLCFHLESLAIFSATIKAAGILIILLPDWEKLACYVDFDSLRWNDNGTALIPKGFYRWFKYCIAQQNKQSLLLFNECEGGNLSVQLTQLTQQMNWAIGQRKQLDQYLLSADRMAEQNAMLDTLLLQKSGIQLVIAARGRGKSALAGRFIEQLTDDKVIITAANKSAVNILLKHCPTKSPQFYAPDNLLALLQTESIAVDSRLIVDEAAMIPLPLLLQIIPHFKSIVMMTTVYGYEGTGRGFVLKFCRDYQQTISRLTLNTPLRYLSDDPLENWVNRTLQLRHTFDFPPYFFLPNDKAKTLVSGGNSVQFIKLEQATLQYQSKLLVAFYQLLSEAHYRTTPLDLRRLLDAPQQYLACLKVDEQLVGALWGVFEGGMQDSQLIEQIRQGYRRPAGNLVAQLLCFQADQPQACCLRSLRISRIAVEYTYQQQGLGQRFIAKLIQSLTTEYAALDYIAVSFGYHKKLLKFWQKCGFRLVYLTSRKEATTGCYTAVVLRSCSIQGEAFIAQLMTQFLRDFPLTQHPLREDVIEPVTYNEIEQQCTQIDRDRLLDFTQNNKTLSFIYPSLIRYLKTLKDEKIIEQIKYILSAKIEQKKQLVKLKEIIKNSFKNEE